MDKEIKYIALYLPQFHPIPENDNWWGKGFTEWTNVGKAKPLFNGHNQPRVPADLGYYDLRVSETREAQAELAKEHGIDGFCYWHYWFGNGKRLLERPFQEVLESGKPDFPFCLGWANHTWKNKTWTPDGDDIVLIEQTYNGIEDYTKHFYDVLPSFKDKRYISIDGKPFFLIWDPNDLPDVQIFIKHWNNLAKDNGIPGIYFVATTKSYRNIERNISMGFDAVSLDLFNESFSDRTIFRKSLFRIMRTIFGIPKYMDYMEYVDYYLNNFPTSNKIIPEIIPNFDHSPRAGKYAQVLINDSPKKFMKLIKGVNKKIKSSDTKIIIIRSWNEWAEGNYLEPDIINGSEYLKVIKKCKDDAFRLDQVK